MFQYLIILLLTSLSMDLPMMDSLYQRIEWIKQKGYWLLINILFAATVFLIALSASASLMFLIQPEEYRAVSYPEFQISERNDYKLTTVLENADLKSQFCSIDTYTNAGRSVNQEQFCNFNYQPLPTMHNSFDVTLHGLNSLEIRYATVCLLKFPRNRVTREVNASEVGASIRNRHVCQKYRAYNRLHVVNDMQTDELIFLEIQLQLTDKGYESLGELGLRVEFEEDRSRPVRIIIDYYFWIAGLASLAMATWSGIVAFVLGLGVMVKMVLAQRQRKEEQVIIQRLDKKKRR